MPKLEKILEDIDNSGQKEEMTDEKMLEKVKALNRLFGGY